VVLPTIRAAHHLPRQNSILKLLIIKSYIYNDVPQASKRSSTSFNELLLLLCYFGIIRLEGGRETPSTMTSQGVEFYKEKTFKKSEELSLDALF